MTQRRRRSWPGAAIAAAVAVMTMVAVQGCDAAAPAAASAQVVHDLTVTQAQAAFRTYVTKSNDDAAAGNRAAALAIVADAQWSVVKAQYAALASAGRPVPQYSYTAPVFYVPALDAYPQWFVVKANRHAGRGTGTTVLLLFERAAAGRPWTLDGTAALMRPLPALATAGSGYYVQVYNNDQDTALQPDLVGATQAAVVDDGPASPAAAEIAAGPQTTGLYAAQAAQARADQAHGWQYQWLLEGTPYPQYELRTADGGALVFYGMSLDTTTEHPNLAAGTPIPVPGPARPLLAKPTEVGYHEVETDYTYQYAAVDPPSAAHGAKTAIVAAGGAATYARAY